LLGAAAVGFVNGLIHGVGPAVGVQNRSSFNVPGASSNCLDQRRGAPQKTFFVRV
jgi:hypothetical protein